MTVQISKRNGVIGGGAGVKMTITDITASCLKIPIMGCDRGPQIRQPTMFNGPTSGPNYFHLGFLVCI